MPLNFLLLRLKALAKETGAETRIETVACDLMSYESTRTSAVQVEELVQEYGGLDVLANNAGIMAFPDKRTDDGFDVQMQTNHLSHFLLTKLLLPSLEAAANSRGEARIVQHSSNARNLSMRQLLFSRTDGSLEEAYFEKSDPQTLGGDSTTANFTRYHMTKLANTVKQLDFPPYFHNGINRFLQWLYMKNFNNVERTTSNQLCVSQVWNF